MKKPLRILIIDNKRDVDSIGSKNLLSWSLKMAPEGSEVLVRRAPGQDLPPLGFQFDALILSGSATSCFEVREPWVLPYDEWVTQHLKKGTPTLGICYGHQTIARCLFLEAKMQARFQKSKQAELGWQTIEQVGQNELLQGLQKKFITAESHYEELSELPPGTEIFARTNECEIQGFQVKDRPIYGIQFHPEASIAEVEASLALKIKKGERKNWLFNPGKGKSLYDENVGKVIFGNFFRIAANHQ